MNRVENNRKERSELGLDTSFDDNTIGLLKNKINQTARDIKQDQQDIVDFLVSDLNGDGKLDNKEKSFRGHLGDIRDGKVKPDVKSGGKDGELLLNVPGVGEVRINNVRRVTNPKHHPNSKSPEPKNVDDLWKNSIPDKNGVRWSKDSDGIIHRFSRPSNGESHWNGSTGGTKPIKPNNIPNEIKKAFNFKK